MHDDIVRKLQKPNTSIAKDFRVALSEHNLNANHLYTQQPYNN